jgi:hypothetical protein
VGLSAAWITPSKDCAGKELGQSRSQFASDLEAICERLAAQKLMIVGRPFRSRRDAKNQHIADGGVREFLGNESARLTLHDALDCWLGQQLGDGLLQSFVL